MITVVGVLTKDQVSEVQFIYKTMVVENRISDIINTGKMLGVL